MNRSRRVTWSRLSHWRTVAALAGALGAVGVAEGAVPGVAIADLAVTVEGVLLGVPAGIEQSLRITVANAGTGPASGVRLTNTLAGGVAWGSAPVASQGACIVAAEQLICDVGMLAPGSSMAVLIGVVPNAIAGAGQSVEFSLTTAAGSREPDAVPLDNRVVTDGSGVSGGSSFVEPMVEARAWHEAVLLRDGTVLMSGGGQVPLFERFRPDLGRFSSLQSASRWIPSRTVPLADGRLLLIENGGTTNQVLDPDADVIVPVANTTYIRGYSAGVLLTNGEALLIGGDWQDPRTELFNPVSGSFRPGPSLAYARSDFTATRLRDGRLLVAGGTSALEAAASGELYDPGPGTFAPAGLLVAPRRYHAASLVPDGRVLLSGGWIYTTDSRILEWYEPGTGAAPGRFVSAGLLREPRANHTSTLLPDGRVLIAGGESTNVWLHRTTEIFDPATGRTEPGPRMAVSRSRHTATLLADGRVLLAGGESRERRFGFWASDFLRSAEVLDVHRRPDFPEVRVRDGVALEEDGGLIAMEFVVELSRASTGTVSMAYGTADFTATRFEDYTPTNGVLTFAPGVTRQTVQVMLRGDRVVEPDEVFWLELTDVTGAWVGRNQAMGRIENDDGVPVVSAGPVTISEGDADTTPMLFPITLSISNQVPVLVRYRTGNAAVAPAAPGQDYYPVDGVVIFAPGVVRQNVQVPVRGDTVAEGTERVRLVLEEVGGAVLGTAEAEGTILDDDGLPGRLARFDWDVGPGPWYAGVPFPVTVSARDALGQTVSGPGVGLPATNALSARVGVDGSLDETFDEFGLGAWQPAQAGSTPGPYGIGLADVDGDGRESPAAFLWPDFNAPDGFLRTVRLEAGRRYRFRVGFALNPGGNESIYVSGWTRVWVDGLAIAAQRFDVLPPTREYRAVLSGVFTAPVTRDYPVSLLCDVNGAQSARLVAWFDDFSVSGLDMDPVTAMVPTNGVWTGWVTLAGAAGEVTLRADDNNGHVGWSATIPVLPAADLVFARATAGVAQGTLRVGGWLTNSLTVSNVGVSGASGVVMTGTAADGLRFVSASAPQGACELTPETVRCTWAGLTNRGVAAVSVVLRPVRAGAWTNQYLVSATEHDPDPANNVSVVGSIVQLPLVSVQPGSGWEGDGGPTNLIVPVALSGASSVPVSVRYAAVNDTAVAGRDFVAVEGFVTFPPFVTNATIAVPLIGNILDEPDRALRMTLFAPTNAIVSVAEAMGIIRDDDAPPSVSIYDAMLLEGDTGQTNLAFVVTLSKPSIVDVQVNAYTVSATASAGSDYVAQFRTVVFEAGVTSQIVQVPVLGDWVHEADEQFSVQLGTADFASIARDSAVGTIMDDDAVPGRLDHFQWEAMGQPGPWLAGISFPARVRAVDYQGIAVTNLPGPIFLRAQTDAGVAVSFQDGFESGLGLSPAWTNRLPSVTVTLTNETAASGQRSLRLTGGNPNLSLLARVPTNRATSIRFALRAAQTNVNAGEFTVSGGLGYTAASFRMNADRRMGLRDSGGKIQGVPYEAGRWYRVELVLDWALRQSRCLIDGSQVAASSFLGDSFAGIDTLSLNNPGGGTVWWDDIELRETGLTQFPAVTPSTLVGWVDGVWTGRVTVATAAAGVVLRAEDELGRTGTSVPFNVDPTPPLRLLLPAQLLEGAAPVAASVELPVPMSESLTVSLSANEPSELILPAFVVLPAGQTRAAFSVVSPEDSDLTAVRPVIVTASSTLFPAATSRVDVIDNETAQLALAVVAPLVEGRLVAGAGQLTASAAPTFDVRVSLASDDTNVVAVPAEVVLPAGRTSVTFDLMLPDNGRIEAPRSTTLRARAGSWSEGTAVASVADDESRVLAVGGPGTVREGLGTVAQSFWVELSGTLPTNLVVTVASSDPGELQTVATVVISAGLKSAFLSVVVPDDGEQDGAQAVTLTVAAPGFENGTKGVSVADNELHHLTFDVLPSRATSGVPFTVRVQARDVRGAAITPPTESLVVEGFDESGNRVPVQPATGTLGATGVWLANLTVSSLPKVMGLRVRTTSGVEAESDPFLVEMPKSRILGSVGAEHLVWDPISARLYASVTNLGIVVIDPVAGAVGRSVPVPGLPTRLALSRGGEYLYVGAIGTNRVRRFTLPDLALDLDFSIGNTTSWGPALTEDLVVLPDRPRSIAVSRRRLNVSPRHESVTIYDDGVPRPQAEQEHAGSNLIEFGADGSVIYGINNETSPSRLFRLAVSADGVAIAGDSFNPVAPFATRETTFDAGRLYADSGEVLDPLTGFKWGSVGGGNVTPDSRANRVSTVGLVGNRLAGLNFLNQRTLTSVGGFQVTNILGAPMGLTRWGDLGAAFRTSGGQIVLVYTPLLALAPPEPPRITSWFRSPDRFEVRFTTLPDRYYQLEFALEPAGVFWQPVPGGFATGTGNAVSVYHFERTDLPRRLYRVRAEH